MSSSRPAPNRCSSQAWNAVPRRAYGSGRAGIGRRSVRASACGSRRSATSCETERCPGSATSIGPTRWASSARSARSRSASRRQRSRSGSHRGGRGDSAVARRRHVISRCRATCDQRRRHVLADQGRRLGHRRPPAAQRIGGPLRPDHHLGGRVDRVTGRLRRPGVDHVAVAGQAAVVHLAEEDRRATGQFRPVAPPVAGAEQQPARPGHRHVREPPLLPLVVGPPLLGEGGQRPRHPLLVRHRVEVQHRQPVRVAAQRERQHAQPEQIVVGVTDRPRPDTTGQPGHRDHVPLQALRGVRGDDLHRALHHLELPRRQSPLLLLGGGEEGQEAGEGGVVRLAGEPGGHVTERVQVPPGQAGVAAPAVRTGPDRDLHLQADGPLHVGHQVGQRLVQPVPQQPQLQAVRPQPGVPLGRVRLRRPQVGQRLDQGRVVQPVGGDLRLGVGVGRGNSRRAAAIARARRCSATRSRGPIRHRAPVSNRSRAAPSVGSASTRSVQTTSRTSGVSSRPPSPTTSTGSPRSRSAASMAGIWLRTRTSTALVGRRSTGMCSGSAAGIRAAPRQAASTLSAIQSASSSYVGSSAQCTVPAVAPRAVRPGIGSSTRMRGGQLGDLGAGRPQRDGEPVGHAEDLRPVPPARGQRQGARRDGRRRGRTRSGTGPGCRRSRRASRRSTGTGRRPR